MNLLPCFKSILVKEKLQAIPKRHRKDKTKKGQIKKDLQHFYQTLNIIKKGKSLSYFRIVLYNNPDKLQMSHDQANFDYLNTSQL